MGTRNKDEEREEDDFIKVLLTGQPRPVLSYWVGPAGSRPPAKRIFFSLQSIKSKHCILYIIHFMINIELNGSEEIAR